MISFFKKPHAWKEVQELFQYEPDKLLLTYEYLTVETSFGNTNILVTGKENKPPLVLIYGVNGCAPFELESVFGLINDFRVYAIDGLDHSTLNTETVLLMQDNSYGQWMFELLAWLNIRDAVLVGISFGGFIGWKTLLFDERHVSKAFFIVPTGIVNSGVLSVLWRTWLPLKLYKWLKHSTHIRQFSEELFTEYNELTMTFFAKVLLQSEITFSPIPIIKKEEAQKIKTPIHIVAAEKDLLYPGIKMLKRSKAIFPTLGEVLLLKDSRHVPDRKGNEKIVDFIKNLAK